MPTDIEIYRGSLAGSEMGMVNSPKAVRVLVRELFTVSLDDSATAGTAIAERLVYTALERGVVAIKSEAAAVAGGSPLLSSTVAITANNTNYATVSMFRRRAGVQAAIASITTQITGGGSIAAYGFVPLVVTAADNGQLEIGDSVTISVTKTGTGVAISAAGQPALLTFGIEKN